MPVCRSCGKPIIWIKTPAGKSMPCDPAPVSYKAEQGAKGKVVTNFGETISAELNVDLHRADGIGYISHWSTCPFAERHRRGKSGKRSL